MKRVRWKITEVFKAIGIAEGYQRATQNAEYASKRLGNEVEAERWRKVAEEYVQSWENMGLGEIIPDIKMLFG